MPSNTERTNEVIITISCYNCASVQYPDLGS